MMLAAQYQAGASPAPFAEFWVFTDTKQALLSASMVHPGRAHFYTLNVQTGPVWPQPHFQGDNDPLELACLAHLSGAFNLPEWPTF